MCSLGESFTDKHKQIFYLLVGICWDKNRNSLLISIAFGTVSPQWDWGWSPKHTCLVFKVGNTDQQSSLEGSSCGSEGMSRWGTLSSLEGCSIDCVDKGTPLLLWPHTPQPPCWLARTWWMPGVSCRCTSHPQGLDAASMEPDFVRLVSSSSRSDALPGTSKSYPGVANPLQRNPLPAG